MQIRLYNIKDFTTKDIKTQRVFTVLLFLFA